MHLIRHHKSHTITCSHCNEKYSKATTNSFACPKMVEAREQSNESVDQLLARLQQLSIDCKYSLAILKEKLHLQYVNNVHAVGLKKKLLGAEHEPVLILFKRSCIFEQVDNNVRTSHRIVFSKHIKLREAVVGKSLRDDLRPPAVFRSRTAFFVGVDMIIFFLSAGTSIDYNYCKVRHKAAVCFKAAAARNRNGASVPTKQFSSDKVKNF